MKKMDKDFTDDEVSSSSSDGESAIGKIDDVHPLTPNWVLWLWLGDREKTWAECLERQCHIGTVEDFIAMKHRILPPSRLPPRETNYHVFKEGIEPMWQHPANHGGGAIDVLFGLQHQHTRLDRYWFELLMACLGCQFDEWNDKICGCSVRIRARGYALSIWINNYELCIPITKIVESKLGIANDPEVSISFTKHRCMRAEGN